MRELFKRLVFRHWQSFHGVRRLELRALERYLGAKPGERILDLGSGKGALCGVLARRGSALVGVDPSPAAVRIAKRYVDRDGRFVLALGEDLPFGPDHFEKAVSVCVLEHTRDDARVLAEVRRVLEPGGIFALTVDCLDSPHVSKKFRDHHIREYRCNQLYSDARLRKLLTACGFETVETEYLLRSRPAIAVLRFGSLFHYRGPFIFLFPILYPVLWLDRFLGKGEPGGMILAVKARKGRGRTV